MFTKNKLILFVVCVVLTGCGTLERTPIMTVEEADRYQVNCKMKNQQLEFLSRYEMDNTTTAYHMNRMSQAVIRRKINYLNNWCK